MWDDWKEKIKNIFTKEVEIEVEEVVELESHSHHNTTNGNQELKAKMMYQYPDRNSFRFPVIPDEPKPKWEKAEDKPKSTKTDDIPAYQKRKQTRAERKPRETKINPPVRQTYKETLVESRKVYKKDPSVPFQLTEVPSPIYGFHKEKKKKEIENIPAYKRKESKQESSLETKQPVQTDVTEDMHHPLNVASDHLKDKPEKSIVTQESIQPEQEDPNNVVELHHQETAATAESMEEQKHESVEEKSAVKKEDRQKKINPISSRENKKAYEKTASEYKLEPFNVIMTPRDKKNLFDRQQRALTQQQEQERTHAEKQIKQEQHQAQVLQPTEEKQEEPVKNKQQIEQPAQEQNKIPYHLLNDPIPRSNDDQIWVSEQQELLEKTLKYFNVRAKVVKATQGPSVTRFEVQPEMGVKVSKIKNLSDDLKLNMSARDIRIEAPIPGKNTVGIEIPNRKSEMVGLQGIFETDDFKESKSPLSIALGLTIEGYPKITNIQKMPHGLIAGATGSGKSVCINTILISLIYKASHEDVKFLLIDPKMVELAPYNGIPHLVAPVITDVKAATQSLKWAVNEMEERYEKFVEEGVRDIERYNQKVIKQGRGNQKMPFIVIVIDELADLMMMSPQDVEDSISRIAQKARACGIHLLLATQRPSVDVITGLIKANIPTRIAFSVSSQIDSRTIIDSSGADKLLGRGDMLFVENGTGQSVRLQGPFVSDEEIERVTSYARSIAEPNYLFEQEQLLEQVRMDEDEDELMEEAIQFIMNQNSASTSLLQRHFKIGYNRAARLIDSLEARGYISGQNGSKARDVLITQSQLDEL
ncbi:DNA translocase FtsK [Oceanobacillus sp. CF4.6]